MNNPSSTFSSDHDRNLALTGPPGRSGTIVGMILFAILNVVVSRHFAYEQRTGQKPDGQLNGWYLPDLANRDREAVKVIFLGNSVQQHFLDFRAFEQKLQKLTPNPVHVYNLSSEGFYTYHFAVLSSQLRLEPSTMLVIPTYCQNYMNPWNIFGTDFGAMIVRPSVLRLLPWGFIRSNLSGAHLSMALLKQTVPLYRLKDVMQARWQHLKPTGRIALLPKLHAEWLAEVKKKPAGINNFHDGATDLAKRNKEWMHQIFDKIMASLKRRQANHLVYFIPTILDMSWRFDELLREPRAILAKYRTPFADVTNCMPDNEFYDFVHPKNSKQLDCLLSGWQNRQPAAIRKANASELGLTVQGSQLVINPVLPPNDPAVGLRLNCYEVTLSTDLRANIGNLSYDLAVLPRVESGPVPEKGFWRINAGRLYIALPSKEPAEIHRIRIQTTEPDPPFLQVFRKADQAFKPH